MANPNMRGIASVLAAQGRNGDTMLMHVAPEEVRALNQMGGLTANPDTGLPEAFKLKKLLPILGSTFLGPAFKAAGFSPAVSNILGTTAGTMLGGGSLEKGIMSGLVSSALGRLGTSLDPEAAEAAKKDTGYRMGLFKRPAADTEFGARYSEALRSPQFNPLKAAQAATSGGLDNFLTELQKPSVMIPFMTGAGELARMSAEDKYKRQVADMQRQADERRRRAYERNPQILPPSNPFYRPPGGMKEGGQVERRFRGGSFEDEYIDEYGSFFDDLAPPITSPTPTQTPSAGSSLEEWYNRLGAARPISIPNLTSPGTGGAGLQGNQKTLSDLLKSGKFKEAFKFAEDNNLQGMLIDPQQLKNLRDPFTREEAKSFIDSAPDSFFMSHYGLSKADFDKTFKLDPSGAAERGAFAWVAAGGDQGWQLSETGFPFLERAIAYKEPERNNLLKKFGIPALSIILAAAGIPAQLGTAVAGSKVGTALGLGTLGTSGVTALGSAIIGAAGTALQGGNFEDILKSALISGGLGYLTAPAQMQKLTDFLTDVGVLKPALESTGFGVTFDGATGQATVTAGAVTPGGVSAPVAPTPAAPSGPTQEEIRVQAEREAAARAAEEAAAAEVARQALEAQEQARRDQEAREAAERAEQQRLEEIRVQAEREAAARAAEEAATAEAARQALEAQEKAAREQAAREAAERAEQQRLEEIRVQAEREAAARFAEERAAAELARQAAEAEAARKAEEERLAAEEEIRVRAEREAAATTPPVTAPPPPPPPPPPPASDLEEEVVTTTRDAPTSSPPVIVQPPPPAYDPLSEGIESGLQEEFVVETDRPDLGGLTVPPPTFVEPPPLDLPPPDIDLGSPGWEERLREILKDYITSEALAALLASLAGGSGGSAPAGPPRYQGTGGLGYIPEGQERRYIAADDDYRHGFLPEWMFFENLNPPAVIETSYPGSTLPGGGSGERVGEGGGIEDPIPEFASGGLIMKNPKVYSPRDYLEMVRGYQVGGLSEITVGQPDSPDSMMTNGNKELVDLTRAVILGEVNERPDEIIQKFIDLYGYQEFQRLRDETLDQMAPGSLKTGLINGDTGGMDDMVDGVIGSQERVAVSPGEFIVPADVVAALGDGNTQKGGKELEKMMERVRLQKYGRNQQPPPVNLETVMPV